MTDPKLDLDFDGLRKDILDKMEANAPAAGGFVVHDARRRLQAIEEPKFGRGYRRHIVAGLLDFAVDRNDDGVTLFVGVKATNESRHHGFYIELGSRRAPAHPFLRPAVVENARKILELLFNERPDERDF